MSSGGSGTDHQYATQLARHHTSSLDFAPAGATIRIGNCYTRSSRLVGGWSNRMPGLAGVGNDGTATYASGTVL